MSWSSSVFYAAFFRSIYISTSGVVFLAKCLLNYSQNITLKFTYHVLQLLQNYRQPFRSKIVVRELGNVNSGFCH